MKLLPLYLIVSATFLVQSFHSAQTTPLENSAYPLQGYRRIAFPQSKDNTLHKKRKPKPLALSEIRNVLTSILQEVAAPLKEQKRDTKSHKHSMAKGGRKAVAHKSRAILPEWNKWTDWSSCSVSCGKGREIRWRHCMNNCNGVETEMEEKACQLPACIGKLFGLIKL
ncbi:hypothetical protein Zmor_007493 [Zophobas morio]|uniref:Uncharacterized protein n=1 Tax=Zophobas morio TaxID=2755281 RepID=A0AA38MPM6_9CUCU|nr:hypothetical protein Zmor_007493 [Zophobas morio]